jgi:small-conductance mechanosensitive channel
VARSETKKKRSFGERIRSRVRETVGLGKTLVNEPKSFPGELWLVLKRSLRTLWDARGGGLYACGYVIAFVWLEIKAIAGELLASESALSFVTQQFAETIFRLISDSFVNSILAFVWPAFVLDWSPMWGAILLGVLYFAFPRYLKPLLNRWLFDDEPEAGS